MPKITSFNHGPTISIRKKLENPVIDGYCYVYSKEVKSTIHLECRNKKRKHCPGTGKIVGDHFFLLSGHDHVKDELADILYAFEKALYTAATQDRLKSVKSIYNEISLRHPEAAIIKTWKIMEPRIRHWRTKVQPPIPQNLQEYQQILDDPQWIFLRKNNHDTSLMHVTTLKCEDNSYVTVFGNITLLQQIETSQLFMDATFKIVPKKPKALQFFTILALVNHTVIPIFWSLMERKSSSAYIQVLRCLSLLAPRLVPNIIVSDFEAALPLAIRQIYPEVSHKRCFFHYCQALTKKLKTFHLLSLVKQWKMGQVLIKKFFALALLPADKIQEAFQWIINNMPEPVKILFGKFIEYYEKQWIKTVQPNQFSVYCTEIRTNNYAEAYNRVLKRNLGVHPSIWIFTEYLRNHSQMTLLEYRSLMIGNNVKRARRDETIIFNNQLRKILNLYELNLINSVQFLAFASHELKAFSADHINDGHTNVQIILKDDINDIVHNSDDFSNLEVFKEFDINTAFVVVD